MVVVRRLAAQQVNRKVRRVEVVVRAEAAAQEAVRLEVVPEPATVVASNVLLPVRHAASHPQARPALARVPVAPRVGSEARNLLGRRIIAAYAVRRHRTG